MIDLFPRRQVHVRADFIPSIGRAVLRGERVASTCSITDLGLNHSTTTAFTQHTKMVYLDTMEEWQRQAKLLFQARPATVRKSTTHRLLAEQQC